jgi:signal transduction histidine kinase
MASGPGGGSRLTGGCPNGRDSWVKGPADRVDAWGTRPLATWVVDRDDSDVGDVMGPGTDSTAERLLRLLLLAALLVASWVAVYAAGGTRTAAPHLFYLPVLYAALRFSPPVAAAAAVAAGILCGPLMPLDVETGTAQALTNWTPRLAAFVVAALAASLLIRRDRTAAARQHEAAAAQLELATQREAAVQVLAHELRTPLTVLTGALSTMEVQGLINDRCRPLADAMQRAVARLEGTAITVQATVSDETEIYRNLEATTFSDVLTDALRALAAVHDTRRVRRYLDLSHDEIATSASHLRVVITALLDNALRFSPAATMVDVENRRTPEGYQILIRDYGPGIDHPERLLEPFAQGDGSTTRHHQGLGLGLYAAHRVVGLLAGTLTLARPDDGPGTIATVTLPVALSSAGPHDVHGEQGVTVAVEASQRSVR